MTKKSRNELFTKNFYKGIVLDLIIFVVSLAVALWGLLQIPFGVDGYDDRVTSGMFLVFGVVGVASALFTRSIFVTLSRARVKGEGSAEKIDKKYTKIATKTVILAVALPVLAYGMILPWIIAGAFNTDDMGPVASAFILLMFAVLMMPLLGALGAAFVIYPIEMTVRGTVRIIRTRGKEWGQLAVGLFGIMVLALIATGVLAVDTDNSGPLGQGQLVVALLGLPGGYEVKNELLLWVTRVLFAAFIGILLFVRFIGTQGRKK